MADNNLHNGPIKLVLILLNCFNLFLSIMTVIYFKGSKSQTGTKFGINTTAPDRFLVLADDAASSEAGPKVL